jgi:N-acetylated-alpha-linked acidic dipeptidase
VSQLLSLLLLAAAALAPPPPAADAALHGFSPERSAWQRDYERRLMELPKPAECDALLRELTREPHTAGTPGNERVAKFIAGEFRKAGLEVTMPTYDVLLSYPKSGRLEIVGEPSIKLARTEEPIPGDPDTSVAPTLPPWIAYAPSADLTAEVVYVNRGAAEDYDRLAAMGIDVRGKVALARYFGGYRGGKSLEGEKRGVAAILVYSDPIDDGWYQGEVYPAGPWGPLSHFQRGANVYDFLVPGDPLTPGWASTAGAKRISASESVILPKVPMMPLSARDAAEILRRLRGPAVPSGWQGLALADTYRTGAGPVRVHLAIENTRERRTITNVIGVLRGTDEPDRKILLSNHHDAWVYGAVDPSSGTATMISLARALGALARQGLRPRRTIVFGNWDAEEFTLTGSTEWGEEQEADLARNAVVCINVDASTSGRSFSASASPLAFAAIRETAADIADPGAPGKSVADTWRENAGKTNIRSYATDAGAAGGESLPVAILGSGSDYTVFFNRIGVPSIDLVFDGPYGVYHSVYDDYAWMAKAGDPGFLYHAAMARYAGVLALRYANADLYPFDARRLRRRDRALCRGSRRRPESGASQDGSRGTRARGAGVERCGSGRAGSSRRPGAERRPRPRRRVGRQRVAPLARARAPRSAGSPRTALVPASHLCAAPVLRRRDASGDPGEGRRGRRPRRARRYRESFPAPDRGGRRRAHDERREPPALTRRAGDVPDHRVRHLETESQVREREPLVVAVAVVVVVGQAERLEPVHHHPDRAQRRRVGRRSQRRRQHRDTRLEPVARLLDGVEERRVDRRSRGARLLDDFDRDRGIGEDPGDLRAERVGIVAGEKATVERRRGPAGMHVDLLAPGEPRHRNGRPQVGRALRI